MKHNLSLLLLTMTTILASCSSQKLQIQPKNSTDSQEMIQGSCLRMNPPGISESLFSPCDKVALQLIYKKNNKTIISIVRTQSDGTFELSIPKPTSWSLSSTSIYLHTEVDLTVNPDRSRSIVVILKPEKILPGKIKKEGYP